MKSNTFAMKNFTKTLCAICLATMMVACAGRNYTDYTAYVDQRIGTGGHGHVFMGANVPFGLVQVGPNLKITLPGDLELAELIRRYRA